MADGVFDGSGNGIEAAPLVEFNENNSFITRADSGYWLVHPAVGITLASRESQ